MKLIDQFDDEPEYWLNHWAFLYIPIVLFIVGLVMLFLKWPFSTLVMTIGLFGLLLRRALFFFRKKRTIYDWLYFVARIVFTLAIGAQLAFQIRMSEQTQMIVIGLFVVGAFAKIFDPTKNKNDNESDEDD
jgi:NAD/NADP transhydrogenase beta subunit